jgi:opacity protein-like surface antigen
MKGSMIFSTILAAASFAAVTPAYSQTLPDAYQGTLPFSLGVAASNLDVDWGHNRMYGLEVWAQWHPGMLPRALDGFGLDVEARDVNYGRGPTLPPNFRMDTIAGGPMYTWHHYRNVQPYFKFLLGFGSIDFEGQNPYYRHDTRNVYEPGFGLQYRLVDHLWVRGEYDYQAWTDLFGKTLDPQGFTAGVSYDFRSIRLFR